MLTTRFLILLVYIMGSIWANEDESTPSIQDEPMEKRFSEGMIASDFSEVAMALLRKKFVDMLISANGLPSPFVLRSPKSLKQGSRAITSLKRTNHKNSFKDTS